MSVAFWKCNPSIVFSCGSVGLRSVAWVSDRENGGSLQVGTYAGICCLSFETFRTPGESVLQRMFLNAFSYCLYIFFLFLCVFNFFCLHALFFMYPSVLCWACLCWLDLDFNSAFTVIGKGGFFFTIIISSYAQFFLFFFSFCSLIWPYSICH